MRLLIIMDDIASINYKKDSSLAMLWAAKARGFELFYALQSELFISSGTAFVDAKPLDVFKDPAQFYALGDTQTVDLGDFDVILMRKDPPFDMRYIYATYILEQGQRQGAWVVNHPKSLRDCNEKLFATQFSEHMVPTLVTSDAGKIRAFIDAHTDTIVKPLDGMGGSGIFRLTASSPNIGSTLELLTHMGTLPIMAQRYIPEITEGDKRILIVGGKPVDYSLARIPSKGETRGNLAAGGRGVAMPLTSAERRIAEAVAPALLDKGLYFVGLDVIGGYITEINVTSPTCIREIDDQMGTDIAGQFMDYLVKNLKT